MIDKLQEILTSRLPTIKRWNDVIVATWSGSNASVQELHTENDEYFYIYWNGSKTKSNHHRHEIREIPLKDIDKVIARNLERLKSERDCYK